MHQYGVREVEKLLRLPRSTIRALIQAGFVSPVRGPRNSLRFSFQDLIVLRTAQALADARVPRRSITRSLKELRRHLPEAMPLSGLSIRALGERVVVKEGSKLWQAESGQYLLAFEGDPAKGSLNVIEPHPSAQDWLDKGLALGDADPGGALAAYEKALTADPALLDAHVNRGWLLQEAGRLAEAERAYRAGIEACGSDPLLLYNLGVLLEELDRAVEAMEAYEAALLGSPDFADCHYNLALLCEALGKPREAIRHMARYRRLVGPKPA